MKRTSFFIISNTFATKEKLSIRGNGKNVEFVFMNVKDINTNLSLPQKISKSRNPMQSENSSSSLINRGRLRNGSNSARWFASTAPV